MTDPIDESGSRIDDVGSDAVVNASVDPAQPGWRSWLGRHAVDVLVGCLVGLFLGDMARSGMEPGADPLNLSVAWYLVELLAIVLSVVAALTRSWRPLIAFGAALATFIGLVGWETAAQG